MMNGAIINDENASWPWIRVHLRCQPIQILQELIAIVAPLLDMAVDDTVNSYSWEYRIPFEKLEYQKT
jgi:hypothetical protein